MDGTAKRMKKNPILVFTGLAVAALAIVAGVTRERWMPSQPAVTETAKTEAPATEQPQAPAPAVEQPAAQPEVPASTTTEQQQAAAPAAEQPAAQPEAPASTTAEQQQAAAPAAEQPAAQPEAPASTTAEQPATAPAAEQPAVPQVPTFDTVRVEKTGEAVIAGRAAAGSEVVIKLDGKEIGKSTANAEGAFVVVPAQPLPTGSGALSIEAKTPAQTAPSVSEQTVAVVVPQQGKQEPLVAVVSPTEPTKVLQKGEATAEPEAAASQPEAAPAQPQPAPAAVQVSLDSVDYDEAGNIVFSGRGQPGTVARVYVDNALTGDAAVGADGRWSFAGTTGVAPGVHALRVDGIGSDGQVINRVEVPFFREENRKVASAPPAPAGEPAAKTDAEVPAADQQAAAPTAEPPAAAQPELPKDGRIVIQPGNNLWRISRVIYGSGMKYTLLYEANREQIRDPDLIYPGQIFKTPEVLPPENIDPARRDQLKPEENAASGQ